jgi:DNA-binding NarL/FixJ family response regulator
VRSSSDSSSPDDPADVAARTHAHLQRSKGIAILVVDDHRIFAEVVAARLQGEPWVRDVELAFTRGSALALAHRFAPDLALVDYDLSGESGLDVLSDLRAMQRPPRVVMLSGTTDPLVIIAALEAGADGWVVKDEDVDVLLIAAGQVMDRHLFLSPPTLRPVVQRLLAEARGPADTGTFVAQLSGRELEVLRCLVSGMTRAEVAARLYISTNTVRTHVQRVLQRAGVHSTLALVAAARELGVRGIDEEVAETFGRDVPPRPRWFE